MKVFLFILSILLFYVSDPTVARAEGALKVVTTLSTFADLVKTIGGDQVEISYIASPKFNPHFIEPKPSDVLKVKKADLFVHAGLDLELWRWPLVEASGRADLMSGSARELDLSNGISLLEVPQQMPTRAQGDIHIYGNPHYWLDPHNAKKMSESIAKKLSEMDPANETPYQERLNAFIKCLDHAIEKWQEIAAPLHGSEFVAYHNAWPYLEKFLTIEIEHFLEPKPGIPPTPKQVEFVQGYILEKKIRGIILETYNPMRPAESVAQRTGARVITLCQNVGEFPEVTDYFSLMEYNVRQLTSSREGR